MLPSTEHRSHTMLGSATNCLIVCSLRVVFTADCVDAHAELLVLVGPAHEQAAVHGERPHCHATHSDLSLCAAHDTLTRKRPV